MIKYLKARKRYFNLSESGFTHSTFILLVVFIIGIVAIAKFVDNHAAADGPKVSSGISGYCLDVHKGLDINDAAIDTWKCNDSSAQVWNVSDINITHDNKFCLTVDSNKNIVLSKCDNGPNQVWLNDKSGFYNPNLGLCLSASVEAPTSQLGVASCNNLSLPQEVWIPSESQVNQACVGDEGTVVSCNAIKQWSLWQANGSNHEALLNTYTDGTPYEEWCADFVSYIYKQAGYPFTGGESNGWDENNANNIQNQGFTMHSLDSGYVPKPGDVGFFNYSGGHVEIVVSGGKSPTFVYGNSATKDPTTGNGEMEANTIVNDGSAGQLMYYLSPN